MNKKTDITKLNAKRAALQKLLRETEAEIQNAGGNTYIIEYRAFQFEKKHHIATVRKALDEADAIRKWRARYHRYDCQGCTGDYPIYDVYLKGHKTPAGEKTYADRLEEAGHKCFMACMADLRKQFNIK